MVNIRRPAAAASLEPYWREMKRLWRQDSIRRRHLAQIEDVRRSLTLDQSQLWLAWDPDPPDRGEWGGPHYCLGMVVTVLYSRQLCVQLACGRALQQWAALAVERIEAFARANGCTRLEIYLRKGWKQEFGSLWSFPAEDVTFHRDPELLYVHTSVMARASA